MSSWTRQEHANGTQRGRPGRRGRGTWVGEQVASGAGTSAWSPAAPGSCQLLLAALGVTNLALGLTTALPGSVAGRHAWGRLATCPWARSRPGPRCPFPFLSPRWSLNLNEGLTDGRAASASWQAPGERTPVRVQGADPPHAQGEGGPPAQEAPSGTSQGCFGAGLGAMAAGSRAGMWHRGGEGGWQCHWPLDYLPGEPQVQPEWPRARGCGLEVSPATRLDMGAIR